MVRPQEEEDDESKVEVVEDAKPQSKAAEASEQEVTQERESSETTETPTDEVSLNPEWLLMMHCNDIEAHHNTGHNKYGLGILELHHFW